MLSTQNYGILGVLRYSEHTASGPSVSGDNHYGRMILRALWCLVRLPVVTLLVILEPLVSIVFNGLALLGILMVCFYKLIGLPGFPTWTMLGLSIGFALLVTLYRGLIVILSL